MLHKKLSNTVAFGILIFVIIVMGAGYWFITTQDQLTLLGQQVMQGQETEASSTAQVTPASAPSEGRALGVIAYFKESELANALKQASAAPEYYAELYRLAHKLETSNVIEGGYGNEGGDGTYLVMIAETPSHYIFSRLAREGGRSLELLRYNKGTKVFEMMKTSQYFHEGYSGSTVSPDGKHVATIMSDVELGVIDLGQDSIRTVYKLNESSLKRFLGGCELTCVTALEWTDDSRIKARLYEYKDCEQNENDEWICEPSYSEKWTDVTIDISDSSTINNQQTRTSEVSPTSGNAPLTVNVTYTFPGDWRIKNLAGDILPASIGVDFGDKSDMSWKEFSVQEITEMSTETISHTYTRAGIYTVTLMLDCGKDYCNTTLMGTVTVK